MQPSPPGYPAPPAPPGAVSVPQGAPARLVLQPSGWWYAAAAAIAVVGVVVATFVIVRAVVDMTDTIDDFDRAEMPVMLEVEIDDPGGYTIYHEVENGPFSNSLWGEVDVSVTGPDGRSITIERYFADVTYDMGGHDGEAIYSFEADQAGTYTVDASMYSSTTTYGTDVIAVGPGLGSPLVGAIVGGTLIGLLALIGATVLAVLIGVRRGRSRRAQVAAMAPPSWSAPPPGWGAPPPVWGGAPTWGGPQAWAPSPPPPAQPGASPSPGAAEPRDAVPPPGADNG